MLYMYTCLCIVCIYVHTHVFHIWNYDYWGICFWVMIWSIMWDSCILSSVSKMWIVKFRWWRDHGADHQVSTKILAFHFTTFTNTLERKCPTKAPWQGFFGDSLILENCRYSTLWYCWVFFLAAVVGSLIIIVVIAVSNHLHTPMCFFLMNLSTLDLSAISVTLPKSIFNFLLNTTAISYPGCPAQIFFFHVFGAADLALLTVMA